MEKALIQDKSQLRAEYIARRQALGNDLLIEHEKHIANAILSVIPEGAQAVAGYIPVRGEVDVTPVLAMLAARGIITAVPSVHAEGHPLLFRAWAPGEAIREGLYNIPEPAVDAHLIEPDVLLVPMAAFDRRGHRLGYGGGFYDRTIADLRRQHALLRAIGVAFSCQEAPRLPDEGHDAKLDYIVTEQGSFAISR